jgi:hypothetical protein
MPIAAMLLIAVWTLHAEAVFASEAGEKFFNEKVLPRMAENGCPACHNVGYVRPRMTYEDALPFLAIGDSAEQSVLLYKIANLRSIAPDRPTHMGGQRCASLTAEPCKTIAEWWAIEFGRSRRP